METEAYKPPENIQNKENEKQLNNYYHAHLFNNTVGLTSSSKLFLEQAARAYQEKRK